MFTETKKMNIKIMSKNNASK